tara:strand:- start:3032 stop:3475 length:444 start_codon:yes stop_codon:yes gene_type:complete
MNNLSCIIGITLILSSIIMSILNLKKDKFNIFVDMLDTEQKRKYNEIIVERITIYNIGMVVGVILGVLYYYYNKKDKDIFCKVITIMTVSNIGIYYFYPKKPLILNYLTDEKQVKAWVDIYSTMKNRWMQSIVLGFIGYLFISYSMK